MKYRKLLAFIRLYGFRRTLAKVMGRTRLPVSLMRRSRHVPDIAMVGCGQFGFATIGYFVARRFGARFRWCHDPDPVQRNSFARFYRVPNVAEVPSGWNEDPEVRTVYIASNHASHTDYAIDALRAGKAVYVEKPISVSFAQLDRLETARRETGGRIHAGYNRPFSQAVRRIRAALGPGPAGGITLACSVSGHVIGPDHWYRNPEEGTRICGNAGHWIDLFLHVLSWRAQWPERLRLTLTPASPDNPDDNFALTIATDMDDVFSLVLTSRSEPFEGISETVNFQQGQIIATIDDFRRMTLWQGPWQSRIRYRHKDVGHEAAILQPYAESDYRHWEEILRSSIVTLTFAEMVRRGETRREIVLSELLNTLTGAAKGASA